MHTRAATVPIWDLQVRIFHWSLAGFFALAYLLEGRWPALHSHAGYTVALLVLFRVVWGFIGGPHARFAGFVTSPSKAVLHLTRALRGRAPRYLGHDPAGGFVILLLLSSLGVTAVSGMTLFAMEGSGPLADTPVAAWPDVPIVTLHHYFSDFTLALAFVHVAGVICVSVANRENLVRAMFTGRKRSNAGERP